jgi:hypothetical protein
MPETLNAAAELLGLPKRRLYRCAPWISQGGRPLVASRQEFYRWAALPYGSWICQDGRIVLFNRFYEPIWQKIGNEVSRADPKEWIMGVAVEVFFYHDGMRGRTQKALAELEKFLAPG